MIYLVKMFRLCSDFSECSDFSDNVQNFQSMFRMFRICSEFSVNVQNVQNFQSMFRICSEFAVNVQNIHSMFRICYKRLFSEFLAQKLVLPVYSEFLDFVVMQGCTQSYVTQLAVLSSTHVVIFNKVITSKLI
jgi:hypothetical protein